MENLCIFSPKSKLSCITLATQLELCIKKLRTYPFLVVLCVFAGLPPAAARRQDPGAGQRGEAHHAACQEPPPAPVGTEGLRVSADHPGQQAPGPGAAFQQLLGAVSEHIGEHKCVCFIPPEHHTHTHSMISVKVLWSLPIKVTHIAHFLTHTHTDCSVLILARQKKDERRSQTFSLSLLHSLTDWIIHGRQWKTSMKKGFMLVSMLIICWYNNISSSCLSSSLRDRVCVSWIFCV